MNRGTPPTAPNARTGEFTPPGVTSRARAKSTSLRSATLGLAGVDEVLKRPQRVRQRVLLRRAEPARGHAVGKPRRRGEHVAVTAVPAEARYHAFRLAVEPAGPPLVFVGGRAPRHHEEQHPAQTGRGHRTRVDSGRF